MDNGNDYFDIQADMGITKHLGGRIATKELASFARIKPGDSVLEIGCGMGRTACFLAKTYRCTIKSIDISPLMVERAKKRALKMGVADRVEFIVADAQALPFEEARFDAVIDESVSAFIPDQPQAFQEYLRVLKRGGTLAVNEVTWIKQPEAGMITFAKTAMGGARFHDHEGWKRLLADAGFAAVEVHRRPFNAWEQLIGELQQFNLIEYLQAVGRFMVQIVINPKYWRFVKKIFAAPKYLFTFTSHIEQAFYIGKKD